MTEVDREEQPSVEPSKPGQPDSAQSADHCDDRLAEEEPEPVPADGGTSEEADRWEWL